MLRPRFVVMSMYSGASGGTGKSTLAAGLAVLLSRYLSADTALIDLGSTAASTRLLGVVPSGAGVLDYLAGVVGDVGRVITRSSLVPTVHVVPPGMPPSIEYVLDTSPEDLGKRWEGLLYGLLEHTSSRVVIIDLPPNPPRWVVDTILPRSQVVNLVLENTSTSEYVLAEIDSTVTRGLASGGRVVNIVLNKTVPGVDITDRVRGFARGGFITTLPLSPITHYLVASMKLPVLYQAGGTLADFQRVLEQVASQLTRQVRILLTGRVEYGQA